MSQYTEYPPDQLPEQDLAVLPPDEYYVYEAPKSAGGRSGCLWGIAGALGCLSLLLLPIMILIFVGGITLSDLVNRVTGILATPPPAIASVISSKTILTGIQPMGQLVSISAQLAKADIFIGIQQGALNACGFAANHVAQGTVEAGIDLASLTEDDIRFDAVANTYTLTLPAAQLTSCRVDFIRQYDRSVTACPVDWDEARVLASYQAIQDFRQDASEGGITTRAQREAQIVLGNFINALTGSGARIIFKPSPSPAVPVSCDPEVPQGWTRDVGTGNWIRQQ